MNLNQEVPKQSDPPFQFRISSLLIFTAFVAIHFAVPILLKALVTTVFFVLAPGLLLWWLYPLSKRPGAEDLFAENWIRGMLLVFLPLYLTFVALFWFDS